MGEIEPVDAALLEAIQEPLPLIQRPFAPIAERLGIPVEEALARLRRLIENRRLRRLSVLLDGRKLGYKSTLVAVQVPGEHVEAAVERINAHPWVSHNYLRSHPYNIWFTLALQPPREFSSEVEELLEGTGFEDYLVLPAERTYKLRVRLPVGERSESGGSTARFPETPDPHRPPPADLRIDVSTPPAAPALDHTDKGILRELQSPFPLESRPWRVLAERAGVREETLLERTRALQEAGIIRRISGVLYHRRTGSTSNAMICLRISPERSDEAGRIVASRREVSHCILRNCPSRWPYQLYAMVHGPDETFCRSAAAQIAEESGAEDYVVLFSTREFKKERIYYSLEDV